MAKWPQRLAPGRHSGIDGVVLNPHPWSSKKRAALRKEMFKPNGQLKWEARYSKTLYHPSSPMTLKSSASDRWTSPVTNSLALENRQGVLIQSSFSSLKRLSFPQIHREDAPQFRVRDSMPSFRLHWITKADQIGDRLYSWVKKMSNVSLRLWRLP